MINFDTAQCCGVLSFIQNHSIEIKFDCQLFKQNRQII